MTQVILTVDLGFGDAGKGSVVDFLCREHGAHTVVRYNGGAQAGHRVVDGGHAHVFSQFGSGTLAGAATHLSRFMLVEPLAMMEEAAHLRTLGRPDPFGQTTIDARAPLVTPWQRAVNRLRELARGEGRHGSCGMGVGETMADLVAHGAHLPHAGDLSDPARLRPKLAFVRQLNLDKMAPLWAALPEGDAVAAERRLLLDPETIDWLIEAYGAFARRARVVAPSFLRGLLGRPGTVLFEGAQGVLLDEWRGFHPYTTWSTTTLANADTLLAEAGYGGSVTRVGITRGYATRHGAGPFVSEEPGLGKALPDAANGFGAWQRGFRVGWLDLVMLRYALAVSGPLDYLAVTCLDRLLALPELKLCTAHRYQHRRVEQLPPSRDPHSLPYQERLTAQLMASEPLLENVEDVEALLARLASTLDLPVGLVSMGPTAADKRRLACAIPPLRPPA